MVLTKYVSAGQQSANGPGRQTIPTVRGRTIYKSSGLALIIGVTTAGGAGTGTTPVSALLNALKAEGSGVPLMGKDGKPVVDKNNQQILAGRKTSTSDGPALIGASAYQQYAIPSERNYEADPVIAGNGTYIGRYIMPFNGMGDITLDVETADLGSVLAGFTTYPTTVKVTVDFEGLVESTDPELFSYSFASKTDLANFSPNSTSWPDGVVRFGLWSNSDIGAVWQKASYLQGGFSSLNAVNDELMNQEMLGRTDYIVILDNVKHGPASITLSAALAVTQIEVG